MFQYPIGSEIVLALPGRGDAQRLFAQVDANREHLAPWLPWVEETRGAADSAVFIEEAQRGFVARRALHLLVLVDGELVGLTSLHAIEWGMGRACIGYWIAGPRQGRGTITRTTRSLLHSAFCDLGLSRVRIHCAEGNARSRAIPERLGFRVVGREGGLAEADARGRAMVVYEMRARDWGRVSGAFRPGVGAPDGARDR